MKSLKGHLLIASPTLVTPFFSKTVILMLEHSESGAMGVVLNRPSEHTIGEISEQLLDEQVDWDQSIHIGGPVPGPIMILHTDPIRADATALPGLYTTVDATKARELVLKREEPIMIIANYSGWGPGQLESEFGEDSWVTFPAKIEHVFRTSEERELWDEVVKQAGAKRLSDFLGLREIPLDPSFN